MEKSNLILIGMPGAGKSTVGVLLAKALGLGFLDTDVVLQMTQGKTLCQLIEQIGLEGFCKNEEAYLQSLNLRRTVIATGGSAVYYDSAMKRLGRNGIILYLQVPLEILKERLTDMAGRGVVIEPGRTLEFLYEKRIPLYEQYADITVPLAGRSHEQAVDKILSLLPNGFGSKERRP
jgi:shikimate kinase